MKIDLLKNRLSSIKLSRLNDAVDRLHYVFTTGLLVLFVFAVGLQHTFNEPLNCATPAEFPGKSLKF